MENEVAKHECEKSTCNETCVAECKKQGKFVDIINSMIQRITTEMFKMCRGDNSLGIVNSIITDAACEARHEAEVAEQEIFNAGCKESIEKATKLLQEASKCDYMRLGRQCHSAGTGEMDCLDCKFTAISAERVVEILEELNKA